MTIIIQTCAPSMDLKMARTLLFVAQQYVCNVVLKPTIQLSSSRKTFDGVLSQIGAIKNDSKNGPSSWRFALNLHLTEFIIGIKEVNALKCN